MRARRPQEPQPGSLAYRLGGEEGVEDAFADGRFDAAAVVFDVDAKPQQIKVGADVDDGQRDPADEADRSEYQ